MKTKLIAICHLLSAICLSGFAQGTAFTYQGRLNSGGSPASGSYDMAFSLFATNASGVAIAGPVTNSAVGVSNGLFTTLVDFGSVYTGGTNWLEMAVSTNGANNFFTLAPRQQLTPVPTAITAANVSGTVGSASISGVYANVVNFVNSGSSFSGNFTGDGSRLTSLTTENLKDPITPNQLAPNIGVWTRNGTNVFYNTGNVGIGTPNPAAALEVDGNIRLADTAVIGGRQANLATGVLTIQAPGNVSSQGVGSPGGELRLQAGNANTAALPTPGTSDGNDVVIQAGQNTYFPPFDNGNIRFLAGPGGPERMRIVGDTGNIGIGTTNAPSPLTVVGSIQMGSGGANYAASGPENLRLVRGIVNSDGSTFKGSGFTAVHNGPVGTGSYTITFTTAFSDLPTVTVTGVNTIARAGGTLTSSSVTVQLNNLNGSNVDDRFNFIAIGPQ